MDERAALEAEELALKRRRLKLEAAKLEEEERQVASRSIAHVHAQTRAHKRARAQAHAHSHVRSLCFHVSLFALLVLQVASRSKASKTIVRLNVSGTQLDTHRDTLLMAGGGSYFALMLSDAYQHALDHEGRYFIDRDPRLFGLILQFLRGSLQANPNPNPDPNPNPNPNLALTLT